MIEHKYTFRVMYPDTDQMGTVHHSNYAKYYETARWELFRSIGISYQSIEESGFLLPVIKMNFKFLKTTHYDELLTVKTTLKAIKGVRIWFSYQLSNEQNEMINEAETELAFVNRENWKPCIPPEFVLIAIEQYSHHKLTKDESIQQQSAELGQ
ncbi:MAG: thioesterase family protein [Bacteroidales bacterium]|nr:thioesterase family protein [Bacteroidales bacterium]